jgi:signal transduction histidine kinase
MNDENSFVFVVDDDRSVRESLRNLIRSAGLNVQTFASAQEFLTSQRPGAPNCLVLDVQMPGLSGLDLQQELAKDLAQIPIIFITGHEDIPTTVRAMKAGAVDFLIKPFGEEALLNSVRSALASRGEETLTLRWCGTATEIESGKQEEERVRKENVRLEERTRIAQELHDTLLQTFLSAGMQLSVALDGVPPDSLVKPRLDRILQLMNQGIEEGRSTIQGLRSSDSRTLDLVLALSSVQQELAVQPDMGFRVTVAGRQQPLRPPIRNEIYRIGREALLNAFCHSGAKSVDFELEYTENDLRMCIRDNGCGIDPQMLHAGREGHWGLAGMRERATRISGLLKISSSAAAGTEVQLSVPGALAFQVSALKRSA